MARPTINPKFIDKICPTCLKGFSVLFKKNHQIYCSRKCSSLNQNTKDKIVKSQKSTFVKNFGVDHPMKTKEVVERFKRSMIDKYGNPHALQVPVLHQKSLNTKELRYGDKLYNNNKKYQETCLKKYGRKNYVLTDEYKIKRLASSLKKYGVVHSSKSINYKTSHFDKMFKLFHEDDRFSHFIPMFSKEEYNGVDNKKYKFKCKRCEDVREQFIGQGNKLICLNCDKYGMSLFQKEVYDFLKTELNLNNVVVNDRTVIYPQELDLYIPDKKIAIECDGLFYHSELSGNKNKIYHLLKTKKSILKEVRLIHVFEHEWKKKKDIVKSILRNALGNESMVRVFARNCEVKEVDSISCKTFLENNHIQGNDKSKIKIGLFHNNELISVMTFCKSRFDTKIEYEMSRFVSKINVNVVGGASKLFGYFLKNYNPKTIVSYSDRRFFTGNVYLSLGFDYSKNTNPNYYYISNDYKNTFSRMGFQKHRLKKVLPVFEESKSEWENMKENGFDRIWDCGHGKWIFINKVKQ